MVYCRSCELALPDGTKRCPMCQRLIGLPVRLLMATGVLAFVVLLFGFIWYSARIKNRVDRRAASPEEILKATQDLVVKNSSVSNLIAFSNLDQTKLESWTNRRWRVSGYVDTRPEPGVKVRTLYFAVIQQNGDSWKLEDLQLQSMEFTGRRKD